MSSAVTTNKHYDLMINEVMEIRDVCKGGKFIKDKRTHYLPHPSEVDDSSLEQQERYDRYLSRAEFDEFTNVTQRVMIGRMKLNDVVFNPPAGLEYLNGDVDKDGLSMRGLIENCADDALSVGWKFLLSDLNGLSDVGLSEISVLELKSRNPRPTIKQYARESLLDWDFQRINGRMQLTYALLREQGEELDHETGARKLVKSYLKLGIDDVGYYQQKRTEEAPFGEKNYILVDGDTIDFIPWSLAASKETSSGVLPLETGFLSAIGKLAIHRYQVSADYKEALSLYKPTFNISGVNQTAWETFKDVNGRDYVASGGVNLWCDGVEVSLLEPQGSLAQYDAYFEKNKSDVKSIGGVFKSDSVVQRTATEILNEAEVTTSILAPIADAIESAIKWQVAYCAMFAGLVKPDALAAYAESIELSLPRDFAISKLSVEEIQAIEGLVLAGLLPRDEAINLIVKGGWTIDTATNIIANLNEGV